MRVLEIGLFLFFLAFLLHLIIWKVRMPKRQTKTILQIFFGVLISGIIFLYIKQPALLKGDFFSFESFIEYFHISIFFTSLTLGYIITYSALEADSPSLVMIMLILDAGPSGLDIGAFTQRLNDDLLVKPRIEDLLRDKLVCMDGEKYLLTPKGNSFVTIITFYRKLINLPVKGG